MPSGSRLRASRTAALLAGVLGAIAVGIATVGLFGMFVFSVQQRTKEIGIRMALGARPVDVVGLIVTCNAAALAGGLTAGAAGSFSSARLLRSYLMGLSPADPLAYVGVAAVLTAAAAVAIYLPARRAVRIDPLLALRHE